MQSKSVLAIVSLTVLITAGCTQMSLREDFGKSTEKNRVVQTMNPAAEYQTAPPTTLDGQKAEKVIQEYRQENSEAPTEVMTQ